MQRNPSLSSRLLDLAIYAGLMAVLVPWSIAKDWRETIRERVSRQRSKLPTVSSLVLTFLFVSAGTWWKNT